MNMKPKHHSLGFGPLKSGYRMYVPRDKRTKEHGYIVWAWWGHYFNPMTYWRWIKRFCQRGFYGYADCDHWSADGYFEEVILGVIRDLKEHSHGWPSSLSRYGLFDERGENDPPEDGYERWLDILDEIIEGLEASRELCYEDNIPDGIYSSGPWHFEQCEDNPMLSTLVDESNHKFDKEAYDAYRAPLLKKRKRAMLLLCKYWESLWD